MRKSRPFNACKTNKVILSCVDTGQDKPFYHQVGWQNVGPCQLKFVPWSEKASKLSLPIGVGLKLETSLLIDGILTCSPSLDRE